MTDYPKYRALWPPYQSIPYRPDEEPRPTLLRAADHRFDAWAPAPGNATPSWTWVSTPNINSGMFSVPAGCWFDPGDHPNPEPYYILQGTLHLSNPDTSDVVELRAGDASNIPAWSHHHGFNFGDEDCYIAWWVPGEMHTDLFKQKVENDTLYGGTSAVQSSLTATMTATTASSPGSTSYGPGRAGRRPTST
jgi:mannose-6-phosphate isomerase-like protein (cupin superfamily)